MGGERSIHLHGRPWAVRVSSLSRSAAASALALLAAAALLVVARRWAGALDHPLEPAVLLSAGLLLAAIAAAIRLGWILAPVASLPRLDRAIMIATSLAVLALAAGLCLPDTPALAKWLFIVLLMTEEAGAWAWYLRRGVDAISTPPRHTGRDTPRAVPPRTRTGAAPHAHSVLAEPSEAFPPDGVTQQLTRAQAADGADEFTGWLRLAFAAGQRTGSVHVAFCPSFGATPELEVEQIDGPEARIKPAQVLPFGARLDLKLAGAADEPTSVLLHFSARAVREPRP